ncbi:hypothetical protein BH23PLA1_BH23PLA1_20810 [soil metagenome]
MRVSWNIGRVAGIDLYLHPTFLILLAFVGLWQGEPAMVLFVTVLFGCVLLHELGHALMARRFGIGTEDITLYPIGGVARLQRMPRSPGAEIAIALAGPAVNIAIALLLLPVLVLMELAGVFSVADLAAGGGGLAAWIANLLLINLILAGFNLIPAFPMDGGRVFRALLSGWLGRGRATEVAATVGQGLAIAFGLFCLYHMLLPQLILATFIYFVAGAELTQVRAEERRRRVEPRPEPGLWTAPPGYFWVNRGNGVWQLSAIVLPVQGDDVAPGPGRRHPFPGQGFRGPTWH